MKTRGQNQDCPFSYLQPARSGRRKQEGLASHTPKLRTKSGCWEESSVSLGTLRGQNQQWEVKGGGRKKKPRIQARTSFQGCLLSSDTPVPSWID